MDFDVHCVNRQPEAKHGKMAICHWQSVKLIDNSLSRSMDEVAVALLGLLAQVNSEQETLKELLHAVCGGKRRPMNPKAVEKQNKRNARTMQILLLERYMNDLEEAIRSNDTVKTERLSRGLTIQLSQMQPKIAEFLGDRLTKLRRRLEAATQFKTSEVRKATVAEVAPRIVSVSVGSDPPVRRKRFVTPVEAVPKRGTLPAMVTMSRSTYEMSDALFLSQKTSSNLTDWVVDLDQYTSVREVGRGSFGSVFLMCHNNTKEQIAVKFMRVEDSGINQKNFDKEVSALTRAHHRCVLGLVGFSLPTSSDSCFKIATPYMSGGALSSIIFKKDWPGWYTPTIRTIMAVGIALGMEHIHSVDIIHRDLKPANILLDECHLPHIADFGCCGFADLGVTLTAEVGTPLYMAPEQFDSGYTNKVDCFAYGSILYELLVGESVFKDCRCLLHVVGRIMDHRMPKIPEHLPEFVKDLIEDCWSSEPKDRPTFTHVLEVMSRHNFELLPDVDTRQVKEYYNWARGS